jgi:glycosyltransferase involved in cell wall biosynthesis
MPLVSIVIPTKGRPDLLVRAVKTVLDQTVGDIEAIVVVDGTDPETEAVLRSIEDPRLRFQVNPISLGSGAARNVGAGMALGKWIAFLDDDDEWLPEKLERQLAMPIPASGRVVLSCQSAYITPHGTTVRPRRIYDGETSIDEWLFDRRQLFGGHSFVQTSSLLLPKALFDETGFPAHGQHEDWEFVITAVKALGAAFITAPEILVRHYAEEDRTSLSASGRLDGSLRWIAGMKGIVNKRAFSGFCLTVVASHARRFGGSREFARLLLLAFRDGRPTPVQLLVFLMVWSMPQKLHKALRRWRPRAVRPASGAVTGGTRAAS